MQLGLLAKRRHIVHDDLRRLIRLAFLAPPIVELIAQGHQPVELTAEMLTRAPSCRLSGKRRSGGWPYSIFYFPTTVLRMMRELPAAVILWSAHSGGQPSRRWPAVLQGCPQYRQSALGALPERPQPEQKDPVRF